MEVLQKKDRIVLNEEYRKLGFKIESKSFKDDRKILLVTSSVPGEGKSEVAKNLAYYFSKVNKKVLLIQCNMRRKNSNNNMIKYGLVDFVYNGKKINDIIYKFYENADVISAGKDISDPLDILQSSRFNDLLINMEQVYDYIILDSSSLSESLDSQVLAEKAGGTIIVVEGESTSREVVNESIKLIKECGGNLFGLVFNKEDKKHVRK